jgi:hypothetical protein
LLALPVLGAATHNSVFVFHLQCPNNYNNVERDHQIIINMGIIVVRRTIQEAIEQSLFKWKAIIIYGVRRKAGGGDNADHGDPERRRR